MDGKNHKGSLCQGSTTWTNQLSQQPQICCNQSQLQTWCCGQHRVNSCSCAGFPLTPHLRHSDQGQCWDSSLRLSQPLSEKICSLVNLSQQNGLAKQWKPGTAKCLLLYSWKAGDQFVEGWWGGRRPQMGIKICLIPPAFASVRLSDIVPTLRIAAAKFLHKRVTTYFRKHRLKRKTYPL